MTTPSRDQVLAASAGWVAVLLNVVPGLEAVLTLKQVRQSLS